MNLDNEDTFVSADQLPDDPLSMPPPYWRSAAAILHVVDALADLIPLLHDLIPIVKRTEEDLAQYHENGRDQTDTEYEEFARICDDLWAIEYKIMRKSEVAILMSAIQAEDKLSCFCVFNLHKDIAESIEKLSPSEKLLVAAASVGAGDVKGTASFEAIKKLTAWRNAFAHGHCTDRPTRSLRHNHLIKPAQYPEVPDRIAQLTELLGGYIKLADHLCSMSLNPYTRGGSSETEDIKARLLEIGHFSITPTRPDSNAWYRIEYRVGKS